ncbi:MAG: glycosyltransferase family 4 protein, partial [Pseudomonadota bacterium]
MHVLQISFFMDPRARQPEQLLHDWYSLVDVAASVASGGCRVTVAQASQHRARIERDGVVYHFVPPDRVGSAMVDGQAFKELLRASNADALHVHGLGFPRDIGRLTRLAPQLPIILQDHANRPPRIWRRGAWRRGLAHVDGVAFCALEQVTPFIEQRVLPAHVTFYEYPGTSSHFSPGDQAAARALTGLYGDPCVLWVGHLNHNKDPLTVLRGMSECIRLLPELHLWCCFGSAPLHAAIERELQRNADLAARVHLLGPQPHERVEHLMRAADLFALGSHFEGSGFSLIESLATGLTPVVSNIASFRALTGNGAVGALFPPGDARGFARALLAVAARAKAAARATARAHFEREL